MRPQIPDGAIVDAGVSITGNCIFGPEAIVRGGFIHNSIILGKVTDGNVSHSVVEHNGCVSGGAVKHSRIKGCVSGGEISFCIVKGNGSIRGGEVSYTTVQGSIRGGTITNNTNCTAMEQMIKSKFEMDRLRHSPRDCTDTTGYDEVVNRGVRAKVRTLLDLMLLQVKDIMSGKFGLRGQSYCLTFSLCLLSFAILLFIYRME